MICFLCKEGSDLYMGSRFSSLESCSLFVESRKGIQVQNPRRRIPHDDSISGILLHIVESR